MILIDTALAKRHEADNPVRVALVGAGFMGRAITLQIISAIRGMRLVAIANRTLSEAARAYQEAEVGMIRIVETVGQLEEAITRGQNVVTDNAMLLCQAEGVDVIIEATGEVEFGAQVALEAIAHRKHVVLMNAELDATVGPILKVYADQAGVIITNADGDQPGGGHELVSVREDDRISPCISWQYKRASRSLSNS